MIAVVALVLAGAGDGTLAQERGDTVVRLAGEPVHARGGHFVLELTIGSGDVSDEYQFWTISSVTPASNGNIWVVHGARLRREVALFDSAGTHLRRVGGVGSGPGEYRMAGGVAEFPDGRVVLRDFAHANRLNIYTVDGRYDTTWTYTSVFQGPDLFGVDTTGVVWIAHSAGVWDLRWKAARVRDGVVVDSVPIPLLEPNDVREARPPLPREYTGAGPFRPGWRYAWSPHGYYATAYSETYAVELRKPAASAARGLPTWNAGDPVISIRREVDPVRVSEAERGDRQAHLITTARARLGAPPSRIPTVPRVKPPIRSIKFGDDGRLWVLLATPSERYDPARLTSRDGRPVVQPLRWREPNAYDVFEPDGRYLGRVHAPHTAECDWTEMRTRGDRAWCTGTDEDGAAVVRRYRVVWR